MYRPPRNKFEEFKHRAGLANVPNGAFVAVVILAIALVGYGVWSWASPSKGTQFEAELYGQNETTKDSQHEDESSVEPTTVITVHVVGAVGRPGVYTLDDPARVGDAIDAAGGLTPEADPRAVNLAALVSDGTQIIVPTTEESQANSSGSTAAGGAGSTQQGISANGLVNINTADVSALETLPGVGSSTAAKIISDREANGPFKKTSDLMRVSGIGEKKYEALSGLITTN